MLSVVWLFLLQLVVSAPVQDDVLRLTRKGLQWDYSSEKIRGVNLGGWFVLEPYITPSLFDCWSNGLDDSNTPVDEYHYCQKLGLDEARSRLEAHWSSWYTEKDFSQMKDLGINMVRIPIGYWAFKKYDYDPYVDGQQEYLDQALEWCRNNGIMAWIDLHGAPGSQNGFDNSGLRDTLEFQSNPYNVALTLDVLKIIADKYGGGDYEDVVIGIELLNEPLGPSLDMDLLKDFFTKGYGLVRDQGTQAVVIHDAFQPAGYWDSFLTTSSDVWNVVVDHHHYQVFSGGELSRSIDEHIEVACQWGRDSKSDGHWNLCGEWSAALTDCAKWLNGVGRGARWSGDYDGVQYIGSCDPYTSYDNWTDDHKTNTIKYIEAQLDAFDQGAGWVFWCWKTEDAIDWDLQRLVEHGIFPSPFDERRYPNQCNF